MRMRRKKHGAERIAACSDLLITEYERLKKEYLIEEIANKLEEKKELEKITLDIITAKSFYESGNIDLYKAYLLRTKERIKDLPQY